MVTKRVDIADGIYLVDFGHTLWAVAGGNVQTDDDLLTQPDAHCFAEASRPRKNEGATVTGWWCRTAGNVFHIGANKREAVQRLTEIARQEGPKWL